MEHRKNPLGLFWRATHTNKIVIGYVYKGFLSFLLNTIDLYNLALEKSKEKDLIAYFSLL